MRPTQTRMSIDSNILVYAELEPQGERGRLAHQLIERASPGGVLAIQALLEFCTIVRHLRPASLPGAFAKVAAWSSVYTVAPTTAEVADAALGLVARHRLQIWDAVIWSASRAAGATILLTEDLQDGFAADGVVAVNPFLRGEDELEALFGPNP